MNPFKGSPRLGATPVPETPYQRAGQAWDERIGAARVQAANWRLMALGLLGVCAGLSVGLVWLSARGTVIPWVVEVDRLGRAQVSAPAVQGYRPTDPMIAWTLARFIEDVRGLPSDAVVLGRRGGGPMTSPMTPAPRPYRTTPVAPIPSRRWARPRSPWR